MATIEQHGKTWSVRYIPKDAFGRPGKQKRVSGFKSENEARAAVLELERKSAAGINTTGDVQTCGQLMETWFASRVGKVAETTLSKYSSYIDVLQTCPVYSIKVRQLNRNSLTAVIDHLMATREITRNTAIRYTESLRLALSWGTKNGIIPINPIAGAESFQLDPKPQKILSDADIKDLVQACRERNPFFLAPLLLVLYGGMRREECAALKWPSVDFEHNLIRITEAETTTQSGKRIKKAPKTRSSKRSVSLPDFVMDELRTQKSNQPEGFEYVCMSRRRVPYSLSSYSHGVLDLVDHINACRKPGQQMPRVGFHDLRHTHAAMLIRLGVQPKVISERLGHTSIKITMDLYGYLMPGLQAEVANLLDSYA